MFRITLKSIRENAGLSQNDLAKNLGCAQSTVGMWESGKREPNFEKLVIIADYFDISVDFLLGREKSKDDSGEQKLEPVEIEMIKKYRQLDNRGKKAVNETLNREYSFVQGKSVSDEMCAANCISEHSSRGMRDLKKSSDKTRHDND